MAGGAEDDTLLGDFGIGDEVIVFADNLIDIDQICWGGGLTRIVCYHAPYSATFFFRHVGYDYVKSCQLLCESCAGCLALGHFLLDSSSDLPLVSGTKRITNGMDRAENTPKIANGPPTLLPNASSSTRKNWETMKLPSQFAAEPKEEPMRARSAGRSRR